MKTAFRKTVIAAAIVAACGMAGGALAVPGVVFDVNGAAGPNASGVDRFSIDQFVWNPGNALWTDTVPVADAGSVFVHSQSNLSSLNFGGSAVFSYSGAFAAQELTYQLRTTAVPSDETDGLSWGPGATALFFRIFHDTSKDSSDISGCGYGSVQTCGVDDGTLVLEGTISLVSASWDPMNTQPNPLPLLDSLGADDQAAVRTLRANGSANFIIDVTFSNPVYFPLGGLTAIGHEMTHIGTNADEFTQANPSNEVVGRIVGDTALALDEAYGTERVNDKVCTGTTDDNCDIHTENQSSSRILAELAPEPGSLALIGLGLGALGFASRRRKLSV